MCDNNWGLSFQKKLDRLIREQHLKCKDIAEKTGVHANTITRWRKYPEDGRISVRSLIRLSDNLNIPPAELLLHPTPPTELEPDIRLLLNHIQDSDEQQLKSFLSISKRFILSLESPESENTLRRFFNYIEHLSEAKLEDFLRIVNNLLHMLEERSSKSSATP